MSSHERILRQQILREAEGYLELLYTAPEEFALSAEPRHRLARRTLKTLERAEFSGPRRAQQLYLQGQALRAMELPVPADPTAGAEAAERDRAVLAAVRSLRSQERDVVVCRWFLGLSEEETAQTLGIPRGTAKSRASRALGRLRTTLEPSEVGMEVDDARG